MARRQVLVQLDDDLVGRLDEIAQVRGTSRSALLREGAQAVITADERMAADRRLDRDPTGQLDELKQAELDRALRYALDIHH